MHQLNLAQFYESRNERPEIRLAIRPLLRRYAQRRRRRRRRQRRRLELRWKRGAVARSTRSAAPLFPPHHPVSDDDDRRRRCFDDETASRLLVLVDLTGELSIWFCVSFFRDGRTNYCVRAEETHSAQIFHLNCGRCAAFAVTVCAWLTVALLLA